MLNPVIRKWLARKAASVREPSRRVAIMVPLPTPELSPDDEISMRHLRRHLDAYDKYLLIPQGMKVDQPGFKIMELDRRHFGSAANHNRMLYRTDFWEKFSDYEYVLMYHLDALVFSNQLEEWCSKGLDYIGAPFIRCEGAPWVKEERVGNGGFALYRVPSVLRVLWNRYLQDPTKFYEDRCWRFIEFQQKLLRPVRAAAPGWMRGRATAPLVKKLRRLDHIEVNQRGNDLFWSDAAKDLLPGFKVASLEQGLAFAFEMEPGRCLERTGGILPFGCHAWARYDRAFWEPYTLKADA